MKHAVSARPTATPWEAAVVPGLPITLFLAGQLRSWIAGRGIEMHPEFTDARLMLTLAIEVGVAAILLFWLRGRGWRFGSEIRAPAFGDILRGVALWVVTFAVGKSVTLAVAALAPAVMEAARAAPVHGTLSWWTVVLALLINPVFEETLWLGYAIPTIERSVGLRAAALISVTLRVLVHFNQGLPVLVNVFPVGVVFTAYFLWTRRLWPIVVAHIIVNAFGLGAFAGWS